MANHKQNRVGEENTNKFGSYMIIKNYKQWNDIDVYFPEYNWTSKHMEYSQFKKGQIKCPYEPRVCNIGFIGEGQYSNKEHHLCYEHWRAMINRCCNDSRYIDCEVCEEWLNFQNFAQWYELNYYEIPGEIMCLDKDILIKGNKIYSPETCCFVPNDINILFVTRKNNRGDCPIGIKSKKKNGKFEVACSIAKNKNKERQYLGIYDSIEEAFNVYKEFKENYIKQIADEYAYYLPLEVYTAMYNWEIEITD